MKETFVVIAGGGTAGHLHPGLAVAEALVSSGKQRSEIYFLASDREIDSKLITAANVDSLNEIHNFSLEIYFEI
jgi:UDP-N-acetylglucosamine:LPS N-acetylglucosamine transferase